MFRRPSQRLLTVLLTVLLLMPAHRSFATDDLLDPDKIGATRKSMKTEGLLDPTVMGAKSLKAAAASTGHSRSGRKEPIYARSMAESVTGSLDTLINAAVGLVNEIAKLDGEARELELKLRNLKEIMNSKLEEFRSGLFCSGCDKTKSEILAKGEQFPHPGQKIVRPTPEQIAKKTRELQAPIDNAERDMRTNRARHAKVRPERDEAVQQIIHGLNLWRTSISFESLLITMDEDESVAAYQAERSQVEGQISKLEREIFQEGMGSSSIAALTSEKAKLEDKLKRLETGATANAKERAGIKNQLEQVKTKLQKAHSKNTKLAELNREKDMWSATLDKLDQQRVKTKQANRNAMARATAKASSEQSSLEYSLNRVRSSAILIPTVDSSAVSTLSDFDGLGGMYRMGSYDPAQHGQILPRVENFVKEFQSTYRVGPQGKTGNNGAKATPDVRPQQRATPGASPANRINRKLLDLP